MVASFVDATGGVQFETKKRGTLGLMRQWESHKLAIDISTPAVARPEIMIIEGDLSL